MRGDARDEIVRKIRELNADIVVLGSRGLGTLKRLKLYLFVCLFLWEMNELKLIIN